MDTQEKRPPTPLGLHCYYGPGHGIHYLVPRQNAGAEVRFPTQTAEERNSRARPGRVNHSPPSRPSDEPPDLQGTGIVAYLIFVLSCGLLLFIWNVRSLPPLPPELKPASANWGDKVYQYKDGKPFRYWIYFGPFGWIDP